MLFSQSHISYCQRAQDGADANVEVSPRDIVYMEPAEPLNDEKPQTLLKLDLHYRYQSTARLTIPFHDVMMATLVYLGLYL